MVPQMLGDTTDSPWRNCKELPFQPSGIGAHETGNDTAAAVFRIPPEVMGQIFVACLDPYCLHVDLYFQAYDEETTPNISPSSTPLVLLRVCRTWRRIALGTPELFTRLFLHRRNHVDPCIIVPMWLQHSGKLPLDIVIRPESWYSPNKLNNNRVGDVRVRPLLSLIQQNIHRVRTLRCGAYLEECLPRVQTIFMGSLREFTLTSSFYSSQHSYESGTVMAPNLEVFQILQGAHYHHALDFIAWGPKLRIYRNEGVFQSLTNLATILLNSPNLEVCILQMGARNTSSRRDWESLKIRLPRLCRLHLTSIGGGDEFEDLCPFLNCLEAPNLEFLDVENDVYTRPEQDFATSFRSLFPAANAKLKILRLHRFDTESIDLESLLPKFTELSELSMEWGLCDEAVFRVLVSPSICPKLSSFSLVYMEITGLGLYSLIHERIELRTGRESLREIVLWQCNGLDISEGIKVAALMQKHQDVHWYVSGLFEIEPS